MCSLYDKFSLWTCFSRYLILLPNLISICLTIKESSRYVVTFMTVLSPCKHLQFFIYSFNPFHALMRYFIQTPNVISICLTIKESSRYVITFMTVLLPCKHLQFFMYSFNPFDAIMRYLIYKHLPALIYLMCQCKANYIWKLYYLVNTHIKITVETEKTWNGNS
jgi:hypothetical protein